MATKTPLKILIDPRVDGEHFDKYRKQGHHVERAGSKLVHDFSEYDVVLGPQCWCIHPEFGVNYIDIAIENMKKLKRSRTQ